MTEQDLDAKTATLEEVEDAIRGLSPADVARLEGFAAAKARGLGVAGMDLDAAGLLNNALEKTLRGDRRWRPEKVGFVGPHIRRALGFRGGAGEAYSRGMDRLAVSPDGKWVYLSLNLERNKGFQKNERKNGVFRVKWSPDESGSVRMWINDELVAERRGAISYSDDVYGPYFKLGVYTVHDFKFPLHVYHSDYRRAASESGLRQK